MKKAIPWGIFIAVTVFFCFALYWAIAGIIGSISYISNSYAYQKLSEGPSWWLVLYYSGEGVAGTVGLVIRAVGGFFALYAATLFLWKKETSLPLIKGKIGAALLFEGLYFLSLIPSTITAFAYYFADGNVFYFDHTPPLILLYVAAVPTLAMVTIMPTILFKLRSKVVGKSSTQDIVKWSSLTAFAYVLVVFWFSYAMAWLGNMVPFDRARGQYGWSFLLEPINFTSFIVTVIGLLLIALFTLKLTLSASKTLPIKIGLRGIGVIMLAFGGYFIFNLLYFYLTGDYASHPNVWYEMIGPPHNVNLWCLVFVFLGLTLLISSKTKNNGDS
jgi:hypothetical protein